MKKLLTLFPLLAILANCQNTGQNVVNQLILSSTNITAPTTTLVSPNVQNIGQTNHVVKLKFVTNVGTSQWNGRIEGSADCVTYFNVGPVISTVVFVAVSTNIVTMNGYGSYPCIRVNGQLSLSGGGNTTVTETYIGTSQPAFVAVDQFQINNGITNNTSNLIFANNVPLTSNGLGLAGSIVIYGLTINMPSTMTDIHIFCSPDNGVTNDGDMLILHNSTAQNFIWPSSIRSYGNCPYPVDQLLYTSAGSGTANYTLQYRIE